MKDILKHLIGQFKFSGDIKKDCIGLLNYHEKYIVSEHTDRVAAQVKKLAERFGQDQHAAEVAGLLHDISSIIPNEKKLEVAEALGVDILTEEWPFPFILHQKLSAAMAVDMFGINDGRILSAISCHTTLKKNAQELDMILFVSDKLQWDQNGTPPYLENLQGGLNKSLKHAAFAFLEYLIDGKESLPVIHPWMIEAYEELRGQIE